MNEKAKVPSNLTTAFHAEQAAGDTKREAEWSINRKIHGPAFGTMWDRYKADPIGSRAELDAYMAMVNAFADVLHDRAAAKAAKAA